ncbi:MAG: GNAT family N-acetyltransferase [Vulcanibacillus sp.]
MTGKFQLSKFSDIDVADSFFDPLKNDYPEDKNNTGFEKWFEKKSRDGATALVFTDDDGIGAFVCLKDENESLILVDEELPSVPRKKISTLRLAERYRGQRLGEGAIGLALWQWQKSKQQEIYVTVFEKHDILIDLLEKFGFEMVGYNPNGECVYLKSRGSLDYSDPYKSFPFINPSFEKGGYLIVDDLYHDTLFPYSELAHTFQDQVALSVANGISKIYVGAQYTPPHYQVGEPIFIYRRHTKNDGQKPKYKSCLTSYCVVTDVIMVKTNNRKLMSFEALCERIGNKSVFDENELRVRYENDKNVVVIELLYYGYFGAGNNINNAWLSDNGYFTGAYPASIEISPEQFIEILREGDVDVSNVIID